MARYGVIDLGSNSVRLVVYEVAKPKGGVLSKDDFSVLADTKKMLGLSSYVNDGVLSVDGIHRATDALLKHLGRARLLGCEKTAVFATAVLRNCHNSKAAIKKISATINHPVVLLSGSEEAHLDFVGATCDRTIGRGTLLDIGGGSTELVAIEDGLDFLQESLKLGSVSAYSRWVSLVIPTPDEYQAVAGAMTEALKSLEGLEQLKAATLYGVGGSARAAAKLKSMIHGKLKVAKRLSREDLQAMEDLLLKDPATFAHQAARAVPDRLHTVGCGLAMLSVLMDVLGAHRLEICRYGVREGYLIERMVGA